VFFTFLCGKKLALRGWQFYFHISQIFYFSVKFGQIQSNGRHPARPQRRGRPGADRQKDGGTAFFRLSPRFSMSGRCFFIEDRKIFIMCDLVRFGAIWWDWRRKVQSSKFKVQGPARNWKGQKLPVRAALRPD
jgi:hypothetical protein